MLKSRLIHPPLISALAKMGHGSRILLADANFASDVIAPPTAERVYLNFAPGMLSATDILEVLLTTIPVEFAYAMRTDDGETPAIVETFQSLLPNATKLELLSRQPFYDAVQDSRTSVIVATGEQRLYANLLLVTGFIHPDGRPQF
jgi:L-fucose mutarotase